MTMQDSTVDGQPKTQFGGLTSLYDYVGGDPVNFVDPSGLCDCNGLPNSASFLNEYIDYCRTGSEAWSIIGGSLNDNYGENSPNGTQNSCAARVSYALNKSGAKIPSGTPGGNRNWGGDDDRYIISARQMNKYLRNTYGAPSQTLKNNTELDTLRSNLERDQAAIVSSNGHVAVVTGTYNDPYVSSYLGDVWKLPTGACSCK